MLYGGGRTMQNANVSFSFRGVGPATAWVAFWVKKWSSIGLMPDLDRSVDLFEFSGS
jgi:hypothetical protein